MTEPAVVAPLRLPNPYWEDFERRRSLDPAWAETLSEEEYLRFQDRADSFTHGVSVAAWTVRAGMCEQLSDDGLGASIDALIEQGRNPRELLSEFTEHVLSVELQVSDLLSEAGDDADERAAFERGVVAGLAAESFRVAGLLADERALNAASHAVLRNITPVELIARLTDHLELWHGSDLRFKLQNDAFAAARARREAATNAEAQPTASAPGDDTPDAPAAVPQTRTPEHQVRLHNPWCRTCARERMQLRPVPDVAPPEPELGPLWRLPRAARIVVAVPVASAYAGVEAARAVLRLRLLRGLVRDFREVVTNASAAPSQRPMDPSKRRGTGHG